MEKGIDRWDGMLQLHSVSIKILDLPLHVVRILTDTWCPNMFDLSSR